MNDENKTDVEKQNDVKKHVKKLMKYAVATAGCLFQGCGMMGTEVVELIVFRGTTFDIADALGLGIGAVLVTAAIPLGLKLRKLWKEFSKESAQDNLKSTSAEQSQVEIDNQQIL